MTIATVFGLNTNSSLNTARDFYAGVECEIESVRNRGDDFQGFVATDDGSLRNNGVEFISIPLPTEKLLHCFNKLHASIEYYNLSEAFSSRTSTHVHINCRSLEPAQIKTLILLYALYENFFFALCEPGRKDNIHCVPLSETHLPGWYNKELAFLIERWHKYTALNILPLTKLGTVEFRHLQGTGDTALFGEWLGALENLWKLCQTEVVSPETLTDERSLKDWWKRLFGHSPRIMMLEPSFTNVMANNLLDVKFAFI
jgi:hypothetical protein